MEARQQFKAARCSPTDVSWATWKSTLVANVPSRCESLCLPGEKLGDEGSFIIYSSSGANSFIVPLPVFSSTSALSPPGMAALARSLQPTHNLRVLDLMNNLIGTQGAGEVVKILIKIPNITSLYLGSNFIGDEGARVLSDLLSQTQTGLKELDLMKNSLSRKGAEELSRVLRSNKAKELTTLHLHGNSIGHLARLFRLFRLLVSVTLHHKLPLPSLTLVPASSMRNVGRVVQEMLEWKRWLELSSLTNS